MKKKVIYLLIATILGFIIFLFDNQIIVYVSSLRHIYLDYFLISLTFSGQAVIIFFILTSLFLWQEHKRKWIFPLWMTLAFSAILNYIVKIFIHRPRPFQKGLVSVLGIAVYLMKDSFLTWNFSFPSFHAFLVFSALPILDKEFPRFKYIWLAFACLIGFSRVYFGLHFLSDVFAGAIMGYCIGLFFVFLQERHKLGEKIMKKLKIKK